VRLTIKADRQHAAPATRINIAALPIAFTQRASSRKPMFAFGQQARDVPLAEASFIEKARRIKSPA
jgi:hypothetical protein